MDAVIRGIVLAAGRSRRMGQPKALLPAAGDTFLQRTVEVLRSGGCLDVTVVLRPSADAETERIADAARRLGARTVEVGSDAREQIDSLRAGLRSLEAGTDAVVVAPVDFPLVTSNVVSSLIAAFRRSNAPVVVPVHGARHGHPVLFARDVFADLLAEPLPEGARTVVHANRSRLVEVPVQDEGILHDVDTPEDFRRFADPLR